MKQNIDNALYISFTSYSADTGSIFVAMPINLHGCSSDYFTYPN